MIYEIPLFVDAKEVDAKKVGYGVKKVGHDVMKVGRGVMKVGRGVKGGGDSYIYFHLI